MRKLLIYLICGLMTLGVFLPSIVKAADQSEDMVTISFEGKYADGKNMQVKKGHKLYEYQIKDVLNKIGYSIGDIYIDKELKTPFISPMVINEDITLYPKISIKKYKISFNTKQDRNKPYRFLNLNNQYAIIGETDLSQFLPLFLKEFNNRESEIKNPKSNKIYTWGEVYEIVNYEINGYKFNSIDDIGTLEEKHIADVKSPSVVIAANITNRTYHIRFDTDGAENAEKFPPKPVRFKRIPSKPSDIPTKTGYKFLGWYEDDEEFLFNKVIYEDTTLTAKWEKINPEKYTIKFMLEGEEISSQEVEFDSQAVEPTIEDKEGFEFDGWYTDSDFKNKFNFSSPVQSDLTLYARWKKKKYTVSFVLDQENIPNQEVEFDSQAKEPTIEDKEDFEFDGWYTDPGFTKKFDFSSPIKSKLTLYARWEKKKYTVSFVLEGEEISNQNVEFDSQAAEPKIETREGFEFDGWYTDPGFTSKFDFSSPVQSDLNLYARWKKKKHTVSFVLDQENIPSQKVEFDTQAKEPTIEDKEGFEFDGWYTDSGFTSKFNFSSPIKSNLTLYARWEKKKYTVSFVLEGSDIPGQEVEFDTKAAKPTVETREGFEFDGWYTDSGFTSKFNFSSPIKSNLTLYAKWNKIEEEKPNPDDDKDPDDGKDPGEIEEPGKDPDEDKDPDDSKDPDETEEPGKDPDQNPGEDQEPGKDPDESEEPGEDQNPDDDKDPDENPDETEEPGKNPDEKEEPGETEEPGDDEKEKPDEDKKPDDNKESDNQKNPDVKDKPNKNDRPSYDYSYDYYDYYRRPNYDYLNPNRNNSSNVAKNKDEKKNDKVEEKNKEEIIEAKVTIPEAILNSYFSDIGDLPGDYQEAIIDLANRSVLIGTGKNNFDPHTSISRAMVAQVLYRLANDKAYLNPSDFTDSAPTNWFYTAVNWANEKGLVEGFKDKTFKPNKSITNEELAVILARAIEKLELKTNKINSIDKGDYKFLADWNRDGIIKMLELDLMDFTFENNQVVVKEISRAEFANIIYKLINSLN